MGGWGLQRDHTSSCQGEQGDDLGNDDKGRGRWREPGLWWGSMSQERG